MPAYLLYILYIDINIIKQLYPIAQIYLYKDSIILCISMKMLRKEFSFFCR